MLTAESSAHLTRPTMQSCKWTQICPYSMEMVENGYMQTTTWCVCTVQGSVLALIQCKTAASSSETIHHDGNFNARRSGGLVPLLSLSLLPILICNFNFTNGPWSRVYKKPWQLGSSFPPLINSLMLHNQVTCAANVNFRSLCLAKFD